MVVVDVAVEGVEQHHVLAVEAVVLDEGPNRRRRAEEPHGRAEPDGVEGRQVDGTWADVGQRPGLGPVGVRVQDRVRQAAHAERVVGRLALLSFLRMNPVFVPDENLAAHLEQVQTRWTTLRASNELQQRAERVHEAMDSDAFDRMLTAAKRARSGGQKVLWLHRAADVVQRAVSQAKAAPCRKGCDQCCHIPVVVSRAEAAHLAAISGKSMSVTPDHAVHVSQELEQRSVDGQLETTGSDRWSHHIGQACPFLSHGECTVWAARPLACRYYYTIDKDDLLCRLLPNKLAVEVPQLNVLALTAMSWGILGLNQDAADIRDWFPSEA